MRWYVSNNLDSRISKLEQRTETAEDCQRCAALPQFTIVEPGEPVDLPCPVCGRKPLLFTVNLGEKPDETERATETY
jgi:hypothetical protein